MKPLTQRIAGPTPSIDNPVQLRISRRDGFRGFRVLAIAASLTNNDAARCFTKIDFGTPVDLNFWSAGGPGVEASATNVRVCWFIGADMPSADAVTNSNASAPIPDIVWDNDLFIMVSASATSYNFAAVSAVVEYVP